MDALKVGDWLVIPYLQIIQKGNQVIALEPRVMELLLYLCSKPNQVVGKEELVTKVWQRVVTDNAVSRSITCLRKALGDSSRNPRYIKTVFKKGYQLIAKVTPVSELDFKISVAENRIQEHLESSKVSPDYQPVEYSNPIAILLYLGLLAATVYLVQACLGA